MASYGEIHQRATITSNSTSSGESTGASWSDFKRAELKLVCPFNIPSSPEAAAVRIIRNLNHFALYYTHFVWIILFISLIPRRKISLIYLVIMTYVGSAYLLVLRALPSGNVVCKILDKRVVLPVIAVATMIELILTEAGLHLVLSLAGALPLVLVHAVFWVIEDFSVEKGSSGELLQESTIPMV